VRVDVRIGHGCSRCGCPPYGGRKPTERLAFTGTVVRTTGVGDRFGPGNLEEPPVFSLMSTKGIPAGFVL